MNEKLGKYFRFQVGVILFGILIGVIHVFWIDLSPVIGFIFWPIWGVVVVLTFLYTREEKRIKAKNSLEQ